MSLFDRPGDRQRGQAAGLSVERIREVCDQIPEVPDPRCARCGRRIYHDPRILAWIHTHLTVGHDWHEARPSTHPAVTR